MEAGFAFGAHGRNLQGKAPYDVPLPGAGQGCVDEVVERCCLGDPDWEFLFWEDPQQGMAALA